MSVSIVSLSKDYPTTDALKVIQVPVPSSYTLYIFLYADWQAGRQSAIYAKGQTGLNSDGSWKNTIPVLAGNIYTVVVRNRTTNCVISSYLSL